MQATLDLVRGLGLANTITDDTRRRGRILDRWADVLDTAEGARDLLDDLLDDLRAESDQLWSTVSGLDEDGWQTPTPAPGWSVATQVAHLLWTDEVAVVAATDKDAWDALVLEGMADPTGYVDQQAIEVARLSPQALLARWGKAREALPAALRAFPTGQKMPWFGPPMSPTSMATARFMETWAHALDVYDALGLEPEHERPDPARRAPRRTHPQLRVLGAGAAGADRGVPHRPGLAVRGAVELGSGGRRADGDRIGWDFCLLVTQRVHRDDTDLVATGADAARWLTIAQAFAGPAGEGGRSSEDRELLRLLRRPARRDAADARGRPSSTTSPATTWPS